MTADTLREAASRMRVDAFDCGDAPTDFIPTVAYWLEVTARDVGTSSLAFHAALAAARAYLGESA